VIGGKGYRDGAEQGILDILVRVRGEVEFFGRHRTDRNGNVIEPNQWAGTWSRQEDWAYMAFLPNVLHKALRELGHEPVGILAAWKERGWLHTDKGRRTRKEQVGAARSQCYCILRSAFDEVDEEDPVAKDAVEDRPEGVQ